MSARAKKGDADELLRLALASCCGAVLVLDPKLRVVVATPEAEALLGFTVPAGAAAAKLLCGESPVRPVAEALSAGRPVEARVVRLGPGPREQVLSVRATPLGEGRGFVVDLGLAAIPGELPDGTTNFFGLWTRDAGMRAMLSVVEKAAPAEVTVLLRGETGTGKELLARALHGLSARHEGPFHAINCAALSPTLLESELFGHERGAFTGAVRDAPGHFRLAGGGTLFLDEIAEMPLELQAKLLRVLQTRTVIPVGGTEPIAVDVRIVSATHKSLRREVERGRFRADLMYRLRVVPIFIPPLRQRSDDVLLLTEKIINRINERGSQRRIERISGAAREALLAYPWPGNVRELENAIEYAFVVGEGPSLESYQLPPEVLSPHAGAAGVNVPVNAPPAAQGTSDPQAARIERALERADGNRTRAAQLLGISRVTLWRRMQELGLV